MNQLSVCQSDPKTGPKQMADHAHSDHKHGTMNIKVQEKTFAGFVRMTTWAVVIIFAILIFMALANA
jgi:hypothetical protein